MLFTHNLSKLSDIFTRLHRLSFITLTYWHNSDQCAIAAVSVYKCKTLKTVQNDTFLKAEAEWTAKDSLT